LLKNKEPWSEIPPFYYHFIGRLQTEPWADVAQYLSDLSKRYNNFPESFFWTACALAACNQSDAALDWLEKALKAGWKPGSAVWVNSTLYNPDLDTIRDTRRFKDLIKEFLPEKARLMQID
jgi:hypothetical protein